MRLSATIIALALTQGVVFAQQSDSTATQDNSAIFLNAASDSKPREVSLGLPTNSTSAVQIYEDGLPVSYYIYHSYPYKNWHGGSSAQKTGTIGPMETALRYGEINNFVNSFNRTGSDSFRGNINYVVGSYGQHKIDLNISGPITNGWQYSLSTYQNLDPGSNHIVYPYYKDRHQFYKGAISKSLFGGRGKTALVYQFVHYRYVQENYGPFLFMQDGSVQAYNGFNLGTDNYRPADDFVSYMDMATGEIKSVDLKEGNRDRSHHLTWTFNYKSLAGWTLDLRSRLKSATSIRGAGSLAGIEQVSAESGYTYPDGSTFEGYIQKRSMIHFDAFEKSWMNNAEISWNAGTHALRAGADFHLNHGSTLTSSSIFSHEVCANPQTLLFKGERFYNFNVAGEYYDGYEAKTALYFKDNWKVNPRMELNAFLRLESLGIHGNSANNIGDDRSNTRYPGFNLTVAKITPFRETFLNGSAGADLLYRIFGGLCFQGDAIFTRNHSNIFNYGGYYDPSTAPTDTYLLRAGFSYQNRWINVLSQLNYISQSNYNTRSVFQHVLQKESAGYPAGFTESVTLPITYGISSLGWMTDAMITPGGGFNLHLQFTLRNPQYKDFVFKPTFSDGVTETYDFSGKNVTNLHKVEICCDPSYTLGPWRLWFSTRYISKQYINKTNTLYFKGRIETFGGADFKLNSKTKFSLNIINLLNQKGASGVISSADLVEDATGYDNFLMSGSFIRPFTIELGVSIDI